MAEVDISMPGDSTDLQMILLLGAGATEEGETIIWFAGGLRPGAIWANPWGLPLIVYQAGFSVKLIVGQMPFATALLAEMQIGGEVNNTESGIWGNLKFCSERPPDMDGGAEMDTSAMPQNGMALDIKRFNLQKLITEFVPSLKGVLPEWIDINFDKLIFSNCLYCLMPLIFEAGPGNMVTIQPGVLLDAEGFWMFSPDMVLGKKIFFSYSMVSLKGFGDLFINITFGADPLAVKILLHGMGNMDIPATYEISMIGAEGPKMFFDGQSLIALGPMSIAMAMSIQFTLDVFFGIFMLRIDLLFFEFEFMIMFQIGGGLASPQTISVGAIMTMSPGEFFPSFDMITTTMGEEGKFKKLKKACEMDDTRDTILMGGTLTKEELIQKDLCGDGGGSGPLKVIPAPDWELPLGGGAKLNYTTYLLGRKDTLECYGTVMGGRRSCQCKEGCLYVKWNAFCQNVHRQFRGTKQYELGKDGKNPLEMRPLIRPPRWPAGYQMSCDKYVLCKYK